jgi:16S rRNA (cytosine1402-N4)-methyltransferase
LDDDGGKEQAGETAVHLPVLLEEFVAAADVKHGDNWVDGTFGRGGHTRALLERGACVLALDCDAEAAAAAHELTREYPGQLVWRQGNFAELGKWCKQEQKSDLDGVLLDLGVSSPQIEAAERGFSFRSNGPLDMRMDRRNPLTASRLVAEWEEARLARIFYEYGDEKQSKRIARAIVEWREREPLTTTAQLAGLVERVVGGRGGGRIHPATRVFQALRMAVNAEREALVSVLPQAVELLRAGGKLAVISFHSGEDKIVKRFMKEHAQAERHDPAAAVNPPNPAHWFIKTKRFLPSRAEAARNPRARSAVLRVAWRNAKAFKKG